MALSDDFAAFESTEKMVEHSDRYDMKAKSGFLGIVALVAVLSVASYSQDRRYDFDKLLNCERNLAYQISVIEAATNLTVREGFLIIIVRPGEGERSSELTRRRLFNIRRLIEDDGRLSPKNVIFGVGEPVTGYGRIEFYLGGQLYDRLLYPKNGYICQSCCGRPDKRYYPDRGISKDPKRK